MKLFSWLQPAPHVARLPADQVASAYQKYRWRNFIGIFIGYGCYYLLRKNFTLAMPYFLEAGYSKAALGTVLSALPAAYGISKFVMGNLSDRSNPRYFIIVGLILSALINLIFGLSPLGTFNIAAMYMLMFANGWAQGMGAPPCYRTVAHWFPISERGRVMSVWNVAHNIGAVLLGVIAADLVPLIPFADWREVFSIPALIVVLLAIAVVTLMRDTPQSVGLMPIEEYSGEYPKGETKAQAVEGEKELTGKEILFKYVLVNKYIWFLALANVFVYFIRYGVLDWAPAYVSQARGVSAAKAGNSFVLYELAGVFGMLLCGYLSDKVFKGRRAPVSIICMIIVFGGILLYWMGDSLMLNNIALCIIGMFIYGPVMLVGVQILDIMPKKAVGTAIGLLGLFAYWGGNMSASAGFGLIAEHYGWQGGFVALIISCGLAILFFSLTLGAKSVQAESK